MKLFGNFFEKNVKFLAIFWQSNSNFLEGQLTSMLITVGTPKGMNNSQKLVLNASYFKNIFLANSVGLSFVLIFNHLL